MDLASQSLKWSQSFQLRRSPNKPLSGDKILLPQSALESLLAAAPVVSVDSERESQSNSAFDPYNLYSFPAERQARSAYRREQPQLPYPLTFRLVNPNNGRIVYAGIKEFSAEEGSIELSPYLVHTLGVETSFEPSTSEQASPGQASVSHDDSKDIQITVHIETVSKGRYVKLRPLEAGYDPDDWKALLENYLRRHHTTLTRGEVLTVFDTGTRLNPGSTFQFLIDTFEPSGDAICVVDTDLEVDIEALNEDQARETLRQILAKKSNNPTSALGTSVGGELKFLRPLDGQLSNGEYVDYHLDSWDRSSGLQLDLESLSAKPGLELFLSPFHRYQRSKPRAEEHVIADFEDRASKRIKISPSNIDMVDAESLWISVHAIPMPSQCATVETTTPIRFRLSARPFDINGSGAERELDIPGENEVRCTNCQKLVSKSSLLLHENFCLRNNILCPKGCGIVFQKNSQAFQDHWHCEHDDSFGESTEGIHRHNQIFHQSYPCTACVQEFRNLAQLARHKTSDCPGKIILCRFCHLEVPQEGDLNGVPDPSIVMSGLTPHELADGGRTTECHICQGIVRLRDLDAHLKLHDHERLGREAPRVCRNINCGRTIDGVSRSGDTRANLRMGQGAGNDISLCSVCFGPLYVSMYDPEGKALKRRVERKYLSQLLTGCGKQWCHNDFCKTGRMNLDRAAHGDTKECLAISKPYIDGLLTGSMALHFCVDENSSKRRKLAELLAAEPPQLPISKKYAFEWCLGALEAESGNLDKAKEWLKYYAPAIDE